jgi:drug/metabolite transporter (DMT)-like permease
VIRGRQLNTWLLLMLVNVLWAVQYPAYRVVSESVDAAAQNFWTFLIATAVLLPAFLWSRRRRSPASREPIFRSAYRFLILAVGGLIPPAVIVAWGLARTTASDASILSLAIPIEMMLMGVLMLKERPGRLMLWSILLALAGTVVISWNDIAAGSFTGPTLIGNVACLVGGAGAAFYNAYGKKLFVDHSPLEVMIYGYIVAAAVCAAISGAFDATPFYRASEWSHSAWWGIIILGVTNWGLAQLLWMWLLDRLELVQIAVSVYVSPFLSLLVSVWALSEHV